MSEFIFLRKLLMSLFPLKVWLTGLGFTVNICARRQRTVTGDKVDSDT